MEAARLRLLSSSICTDSGSGTRVTAGLGVRARLSFSAIMLCRSISSSSSRDTFFNSGAGRGRRGSLSDRDAA